MRHNHNIKLIYVAKSYHFFLFLLFVDYYSAKNVVYQHNINILTDLIESMSLNTSLRETHTKEALHIYLIKIANYQALTVEPISGICYKSTFKVQVNFFEYVHYNFMALCDIKYIKSCQIVAIIEANSRFHGINSFEIHMNIISGISCKLKYSL